MNKIIRNAAFTAALLIVATIPTLAQQVKRAAFDVTNYVMDVSLAPSERKLTATVDVTFTPLEDTRSVAFELNGSLKVDSVTRLDHPATAAMTRTARQPRRAIHPIAQVLRNAAETSVVYDGPPAEGSLRIKSIE